jgi:hypothetical protein
MHVLHLLKFAAHYGIAVCYWLLPYGHHKEIMYLTLCALYLLLCAIEASESC